MADAILWPLESSFSAPNISYLKSQKINQIVVLSGGGGQITSELLISALPHATAYRLWSSMELASRLGPNCELILIGSPNGETKAMEELVRVLLPAQKVFSKAHIGGTSEHPKNVEDFVNQRAFVLVTSAMHMKRAMWCFELQGLKPVAYPVDYLSAKEYRWTDFIPSIHNLWKVNIVFREYLALGWYWMKAVGT